MSDDTTYRVCRTCGKAKPLADFAMSHGKYPRPDCHACRWLQLKAKEGFSTASRNHDKMLREQYARKNEITPLPNTKKCARCGHVKPNSCFHQNRVRSDGLVSYCKSCMKKYRDSKGATR